MVFSAVRHDSFVGKKSDMDFKNAFRHETLRFENE